MKFFEKQWFLYNLSQSNQLHYMPLESLVIEFSRRIGAKYFCRPHFSPGATLLISALVVRLLMQYKNVDYILTCVVFGSPYLFIMMFVRTDVFLYPLTTLSLLFNQMIIIFQLIYKNYKRPDKNQRQENSLEK